MYDGLELAGRYRLDDQLGRGGMGEVWKGIDLRLRRRVAVKLLPLQADVDPAGAARFRREAEITAGFQHPGITALYDLDEHRIGPDRNLLFLIMEFLDGEDLRKVVDREPLGLAVGEVLELAIQVSDGLAAAHSRGVVHRDVKPANLIRLADGTVKICDFGIARFAESTAGLTHGVMGTPAYMAPEQFNGRSIDGRTDLYALGCVLHVLLTGRPPFHSDISVAEHMYHHLETVPAGPRRLRPDIAEELDQLVLELLAKSPADRPPSAEAVRDRLREIADLRGEVAVGSAADSGPADRLVDYLTLYIVNGFRRGHDHRTVYGYLARSNPSWTAGVARRVLGGVRSALVRVGADRRTADQWSYALCDLLAAGTFGAELAAAFRREVRHTALSAVEFELRLLSSAARGGDPDAPMSLTGQDRKQLQRIRGYLDDF